MKNIRVRKVKEITPADCKLVNQCFVCDKTFKTRKELHSHQKGRHVKVIVYEIIKEIQQIRSFDKLWRVDTFDDVLFSPQNKAHKIRKDKSVGACSVCLKRKFLQYHH